MHRRLATLGELRRLARDREIRESAPHELERDPRHVVPALAGVEATPIGRFNAPRPFEWVAPGLGGACGHGAARSDDPDPAAVIVVTRWIHPNELRSKPTALGLLALRLCGSQADLLRLVERSRLRLGWPLTHRGLERARGLKTEAVAHRANRGMRPGARLHHDLDEGERGHGSRGSDGGNAQGGDGAGGSPNRRRLPERSEGATGACARCWGAGGDPTRIVPVNHPQRMPPSPTQVNPCREPSRPPCGRRRVAGLGARAITSGRSRARPYARHAEEPSSILLAIQLAGGEPHRADLLDLEVPDVERPQTSVTPTRYTRVQTAEPADARAPQ